MMSRNGSRTSLPSKAYGIHRMQLELESRSSSVFVIENVVFSFGEIGTLIGNLLAIVIVLRNPVLRIAIPNMLMVSLCAVGLLNGMVVVPISHSVLASSKWPFGKIICQFQGLMVVFTGSATILTIAVISLSRYLSVVKNDLYRRYFTFRKTLIMISLAWLAGFCAPVLYLITGHRYIFIPAKIMCYVPLKTGWFLMLLACFYVVLPSLIVLYSNWKVFLAVRSHNMSVFITTRNSGPNMHDIKITRTMLAIVICFCMCWFPILIIETIDIIGKRWLLPRPAYLVFTVLGGLSNLLNPLIYGLMNTVLRKEFIKFVTCKLRHKNIVKPVRKVVQPAKLA